MATEGRAQRMDKDCPHTLQLLLCGQLRAVSLPFFFLRLWLSEMLAAKCRLPH